jgi:signal transduction histidine kinase
VRLARRAHWLIRLRWIAIAGVFGATFAAQNVFGMQVEAGALYCIGGILIVYNTTFLYLLKRTVESGGERVHGRMHQIVSTQISVDLILLTILLHYSGGIGNPFIIYFVFHMVIASILLPVWESYLQATLAVCLVVFMVVLEHNGVITHYNVDGFLLDGIHDSAGGVTIAVVVLATTLYMIVYMTCSISTRLRGQEEAYWQANIELKAKDKVKDEYVARVTHDIKGHLAAIQSCLEVVSNKTLGELNERQGEFVVRAKNRTQTLATFVRTLLRLTQMRLNRTMDMEEFSMREVVENVIGVVGIRAEEKSISLSSSIDESAEMVWGNRFSIEEVLANLVLNAIKYTGQGGSAGIFVRDKGQLVEVEVSDTGIGIPAEDLDKVFDEFFRASNARKIERDGTGLGLSIVRQIVEQHGGRVWVESELGKGSRFMFTLSGSGNKA